ncbi:MAG: hypothetical protein QW275_00345 [Candidatus Anstonellaceae archaeon]
MLCFSLKAQSATEYLVVLAVVLIIGLAGISLLGFFPGTASETSETASEIYWKSARPFRIVEAGLYDDSQLFFAIENAGTDPVRLTGIGIGDARATIQEYGGAPVSSIYFSQGEAKKIVVSSFGTFDCLEGKTNSVGLTLFYQTIGGIEKRYVGERKMIIRCNRNSGAYNSNNTGGECKREGEGCNTASDCCSGLWCGDNTCRRCLGEGESCKEDSWCCSGICRDKKCR